MPCRPLSLILGMSLAVGPLLSCAVERAEQEAAVPSAPPESISASEKQPVPPPTIQQTVVVDSLEHPWGLDWLPDSTLIITERPGRVRLLREGQLSPPLIGVPPVLSAGQGGLLDVAVHPQFAENRWVYFTYAAGERSANQTRVARATLVDDTLSEWQILFEVNRAKTGTQHFGSRLTWLPDNTLLISIGDGGNPPLQLNGAPIRNQAQNLSSHLGKIVRLNDDGSVPADNPFVDTPNVNPALWSYGHRNIQGLAYDPVSDRLWSTEHGARGGDELNQIEAGANYGWPIVTHSREYSGGEITSERSRPGMVDPLRVWTPAIAPSGLLVYQGEAFPPWQGDLFAGGLVSRDVRHIDLDETGAIINETPIAIGQRVRDVRQGPDGLIYILTDEPNGQLIRLEPASD